MPSYSRVIGWGYYFVTVTDDYSRFILAWKLQLDVAAASLIEVVYDAVDITEMTTQSEAASRSYADGHAAPAKSWRPFTRASAEVLCRRGPTAVLERGGRGRLL